MPRLRTNLSLALTITLILTSCGGEVRPNERQKQSSLLKIYYLWNTAGDPHQHSSIKTGVEKAIGKGEIWKHFDGKVQFESQPDPDTKDEAIALAETLRRSPDTLAVIGHTYSGITWSTLPIFADAGIPVLMPNATSPYLLFDHREHDEPNFNVAPQQGELGRCEEPGCFFLRSDTNAPPARFHNAWRLIPSDVPDQVTAVQLTIRQLGTHRVHSTPQVMLICDQTSHSGANVYSKPMCDYLELFNGRRVKGKVEPDYKIVSNRSINLDHGDLWGLVTEIRAADPDDIVVVGYSELARDVLKGLAERDSRAGSKKPTRHYRFIMTDGAFVDTLQALNPDAEIYFTSPAHPHIKNTDCDASEHQESEGSKLSPTKEPPKKKTNDAIPETAEGLAYDSVIILARAVDQCTGQLDRACVLDFLRSQQNLTGECESYDFHDGERQHAAYYVYAERDRRAGTAFKPKWCARSNDTKLRSYESACAPE